MHNLLACFVRVVVIVVVLEAVVYLCGGVTEMSHRMFGQSNRTSCTDTRKTICQSINSAREDKAHNDGDDDDGV